MNNETFNCYFNKKYFYSIKVYKIKVKNKTTLASCLYILRFEIIFNQLSLLKNLSVNMYR